MMRVQTMIFCIDFFVIIILISTPTKAFHFSPRQQQLQRRRYYGNEICMKRIVHHHHQYHYDPHDQHHHQQQQQQQKQPSISFVSPFILFSSLNNNNNHDDNNESTASAAAAPPPPTTSTSTTESQVRDEIARKNMNMKDEKKYMIPDGSNWGVLTNTNNNSNDNNNNNNDNNNDNNNNNNNNNNNELSLLTTTTTTIEEIKKRDELYNLQKKINRLVQPRSYPLFLAEKATEMIEKTMNDLFLTASSSSSSLTNTNIKNSMTTTTTTNNNNNMIHNNNNKQRIVILGTGWGATSFIKNINTNEYDVTVISPRNYFVFTPMLAGASVGTVEFRSITESIRVMNDQIHFIEATAMNINIKQQSIVCESVICQGKSCHHNEFNIFYDHLIVTVGAQTNTYNIPGVRENCYFLKQIEDAKAIRTSIVNCFERANLPNLTNDQRCINLTFAIIGAGPTGIEFAAELRDFIEQDGPYYYPELLKFVRIKIIEASNTVLAPFDKSLQDEAIRIMNEEPRIQDKKILNLLPERFKLTELLLDCSVKEVTEQNIYLDNGTTIPYGMAVWAAGNGPIPLTLNIINELGQEQQKEQNIARGRIAIDPWLRAIGGNGKILSFGDCSCIINRYYDFGNNNNNNNNNNIGSGSNLPATAQVASQQGEYLANIMNKKYHLSPLNQEHETMMMTTTNNDDDDNNNNMLLLPPMKDPSQMTSSSSSSLSNAIVSLAMNIKDDEYAKPFQFLNLGILAYTGDATALAQVNVIPNATSIKSKGRLGNILWRGVYWTRQVSWRNRILVLNDWMKQQWFGRDITRL